MHTVFTFHYHAVSGQLDVLQDGRKPGNFSLFSRCQGSRFYNDVHSLPEYCHREANGRYAVQFCGYSLYHMILEKVFSADPACESIVFSEPVISNTHRIRWVKELYSAYSLKPEKLRIGIHGIELSELSMCRDMPVILCTGKNCTHHISLIASRQEFDKNAGMDNGVMRLWMIPGKAGIEFLEMQKGNCLFACDSADMKQLLHMWIEQVILSDYFRHTAEVLQLCDSHKHLSDERIQAKRKCLCDDTPYVSLTADQKIEIQSTGKYSLYKLPEDMKCVIRMDHAGTAGLGQGNSIIPLCEGSAVITAYAMSEPSVCDRKTVTVYRYRKVQQIHLSMTDRRIMVSDMFKVQADMFPKDADNRHEAVWHISPADHAEVITSGVFKALKPGRCVITLTIGTVQESIACTFTAGSSKIRFRQNQISVRHNDHTQIVTADVLPAGSIGGTVKYSVSDSSVFDYDRNTGRIIPRQEGQAVITAELIDQTGKIISDSHCTVTILPVKDIHTPDGALVLLLVSVIGMAVLYRTVLRYLFMVSIVISAVWYIYRKRKRRQ